MKDRGRGQASSRKEDATWTKKGKKSIFGYKLHTKMDVGNKIITEMAVTTARTHDGNIDLTNPDEIVYRDKGYSGCRTKAKGNATMKRNKHLLQHEMFRNKRITKKRCRGEHPSGLIVRMFKVGHTKLIELHRIYTQQTFICIAYNFHRLLYLPHIA